MAEKKIHLQIVTPTEQKVDEYVKMVIMRTTLGNMGVLFGHEAHSAVLDYGIVRIINEEEERQIVVYGGLVSIQENTVTIVTNEAQWPEEIDFAYANRERERIERRILEKTDALEIKKDQIQLRRTLMQIEVGESLIIDDRDRED